MLLCDSCPRGFHMACLELDYGQLSTGEWACPKCAAGEAKAAKREARAANKDKCAPIFTCIGRGIMTRHFLLNTLGLWRLKPF